MHNKSHSDWQRYYRNIIASEVSSVAKHFSNVIQWAPRPDDSGYLLSQVICPEKETQDKIAPQENHEKTLFLLNGNFNHHYDVQDLLLGLKKSLVRSSRVMIVAYNPYLSWAYRLANRMHLRKGEIPTTFITRSDLSNLCKISGYEILSVRPAVFIPFRLMGIGTLFNWLAPLIPGLRHFGLINLIFLRPTPSSILTQLQRPSLSIIIPARNEAGNIENALKRMPNLNANLEIIFVEGHSSDNTWEEILRVKELYGHTFKILTFQQSGKGKSDAVRLGFSHASGDLLTILDADLTMPPELLGRFYDAYIKGQGDFINGSRLMYPMEGEAMRFLNRLGNIFFAKALSSVLGVRIGDSLCGTKLLERLDYDRFIAWRKDFGNFDPFGDFELLFPAAILGLGIVDIPIRYRARVYGTTNISRFKHGFMLLRMTLIGLFRIKTGRT